jgi:hypothetical protein
MDLASVERLEAKTQVQIPGGTVARVDRERDLRSASCTGFVQSLPCNRAADAAPARF